MVVTMDADLQDNPEKSQVLYQMISEEGYDLVSGWKKNWHDSVIVKTSPQSSLILLPERLQKYGYTISIAA